MKKPLRKSVRVGLMALLAAMLLFGIVTTFLPSQHSVAYAATYKSAKHCLGAAAFPLNDLCVTVNYTVQSRTKEKITSVIECVDIMGPATSASMATFINIYSRGPRVWSKKGPLLFYGPTVFERENCTVFFPQKSVARGNVGVWVETYGQELVNPAKPPDLIDQVWVGVSNFK